MAQTDEDILTRFFALSLWERKAIIAEYKCSISFQTIDEMEQHVKAAGFSLFGKDFDRAAASDVITGNCVVIASPPNMVFKTTQYLAYVICPSGKPCLLRGGMAYTDSAEEAVGWLSSREFAANKQRIIAENDTEFHEHSEEDVLHIVNGDQTDWIFARHKRFCAGLTAWARSRAHPTLVNAA